MKLRATNRNDAIAKGLRVKKARMVRGFTMSELARGAQTTPATISKIESGKILECRSGLMGRIATFLGSTFEWLEYGQETSAIIIKRGKNQTVIENLPDSNLIGSYVPLYTWDSLKIKILSLDKIKQLDTPFVQLIGQGSFYTFAVQLDGISMLSRDIGSRCFEPGEILYFDPEKELFDGCFVCAKIDEETPALFRQYIFDCGKEWLRPLNPAFPAIEFTNKTKILGVLTDTHKDNYDKPDIAIHKLRKQK